MGLRFLLFGEHIQLTIVETYKHNANPHADDDNVIAMQLILLL
ncbi:MAG: hypothetical protein ABIJ56_00625 [Pseudomonadota bacterium]